MRLNQIIPILKTVKQNSDKAVTEIYHAIQKTQLFAGLSKTYNPREEEGFVYPGETNAVSYKVSDLLEVFAGSVSEFYDLAYTQDCANTIASADLVVNGEVLLANVPVTHLLFLESQLNDVKTFISKLPTLPVDKSWTYSQEKGCYATAPKETVKVKKITDFVIAAVATPEHPAQIREVSKDIVEGTWTTVEYSSAIEGDRAKQLLRRVDTLIRAVVQSRQEANSMAIEQKKSSDKIFGYLFGD